MNNTDELKISEMEEAEEVNNEDLIMIVQSGINKKAKVSKIGDSKTIDVVDNLESTSTTDALSAKQGNVLGKKIGILEEKAVWKKQTINLGYNETVTIPEIKEAQEIYVKASYNADKGNYAIMNILNDGVNGYYNMDAYYWQGAYPISVLINWQNGTIRNCNDKSNIVLVAHR